MKAKLLKKIRRRFGYYKGEKGDWVLVDKVLELVFVLDKELLMKQYPYYVKHEDEITSDTYLSFLKACLYKPFISNPNEKIKFNYAKRKLACKTKNL